MAAATGDAREPAIRSEVQADLRRVLAVDALLEPGPAEFDEARRLVAERIAAAAPVPIRDVSPCGLCAATEVTS